MALDTRSRTSEDLRKELRKWVISLLGFNYADEPVGVQAVYRIAEVSSGSDNVVPERSESPRGGSETTNAFGLKYWLAVVNPDLNSQWRSLYRDSLFFLGKAYEAQRDCAKAIVAYQRALKGWRDEGDNFEKLATVVGRVIQRRKAHASKSEYYELLEREFVETFQILERLAQLGDDPERRRRAALVALNELRSAVGAGATYEQQIFIASIDHQLSNPVDERNKCK